MVPKRNLRASVCLVAVLLAATCDAAPGARGSRDRAIRRSDVVFMYDNPAMYEPYGCTVLGWAGRADANHIRNAHARGVRHFSSSIGFLTEFRRVIDFDPGFLDAACRNFAGEPYIVPWLWDHEYKGRPAYWWCTNSPLYRRYLESRLAQVMRADPDGLHIDDYRGTSGSVTWLSGGFCRHCMAAFRDYLRDHVAREELAALGIDDLASFDYRRFLLQKGVTAEDYRKRRASLPLADAFYRFHVMANDRFVAAYRKRAEELRGRPVALSVNSGLSNPHALVITTQLSYFCCEVRHDASRRLPATHPVTIYKLADGLHRPVASTASGQDWAFVMEHRLPGLVRSWTALSYALGHTLMAPHRQWCYSREKGTHWYTSSPDDYAFLYRFVREHARLLDGYEAIAPVAVVYSNAARRAGRGDIEGISTALAERNMPFTVVIAGDDWLPAYRLDRKSLARFRAVVVPPAMDLDKGQRAVLEEVARRKRLIVWPDKERLDELVPAPVLVEGGDAIWAVPRAKPDAPGAPVVVHLLNRNYDPANDDVVPRRNVTLRLRRDLLDGRTLGVARLRAPASAPVALDVRTDDVYTSVRVPELKLWALVELSRGTP